MKKTAGPRGLNVTGLSEVNNVLLNIAEKCLLSSYIG